MRFQKYPDTCGRGLSVPSLSTVFRIGLVWFCLFSLYGGQLLTALGKETKKEQEKEKVFLSFIPRFSLAAALPHSGKIVVSH